MAYELFLFDLDDTLLDFKESERLSFFSALQSLGIQSEFKNLFEEYKSENSALWKLFEQGMTTKEHLKVERFRKIFDHNQIDIDPEFASSRYLETLPETVVLVDYAVEICEFLSQRGEIGIVTNGIHSVQIQRIKKSKLDPYISFISVSEECGFAKPDIRFFEASVKKAAKFSKASSLVIGDRIDTDIQGAYDFGLDSCWFNPGGGDQPPHISPSYEIKCLSEIHDILK